MPSVLNIKDSEEIRARLDPLRRFVLVLCGIAKKSYPEVAAQPGISRRAVEGAYCVAFDALESDSLTCSDGIPASRIDNEHTLAKSRLCDA